MMIFRKADFFVLAFSDGKPRFFALDETGITETEAFPGDSGKRRKMDVHARNAFITKRKFVSNSVYSIKSSFYVIGKSIMTKMPRSKAF